MSDYSEMRGKAVKAEAGRMAAEQRAEALKADKERLEAALGLAEKAFDNALRSAGTSVAGFIATRKLMARAQTAARAALAGSPDPVRETGEQEPNDA